MSSSHSVHSRQRWMGILARAHEDDFHKLWNVLELAPSFTIIKPAEQGIVMVRGRAGGSGHPFNLGEMTVTRCSVRLDNGLVGHAYVAGRKSSYAQSAAIVDALMQDEIYAQTLEEALITKLEVIEVERKKEMSEKAATTKVDFFTMVRGED